MGYQLKQRFGMLNPAWKVQRKDTWFILSNYLLFY